MGSGFIIATLTLRQALTEGQRQKTKPTKNDAEPKTWPGTPFAVQMLRHSVEGWSGEWAPYFYSDGAGGDLDE